jgi:hypothetical protein
MEDLRNPGPTGNSNPSMQTYQPGTQHVPSEERADPSFTSTTMAGGHQQAAEAPEQTGLLTQYTANLGSMLGSIGAMAIGPGPSGTVGNLCVAVNYTSHTQLDLYVGCREKQLKSYSLEKQQKYQASPCCAKTALCKYCNITQYLLRSAHAHAHQHASIWLALHDTAGCAQVPAVLPARLGAHSRLSAVGCT